MDTWRKMGERCRDFGIDVMDGRGERERIYEIVANVFLQILTLAEGLVVFDRFGFCVT